MSNNLRDLVNDLYSKRISHHAGHKWFLGTLKIEYWGRELSLNQLQHLQRLLYRYRAQFHPDRLTVLQNALTEEIEKVHPVERKPEMEAQTPPAPKCDLSHETRNLKHYALTAPNARRG